MNEDDEIQRVYNSERDAAMLSLDEQQIRSFALKYRIPLPVHPLTFWMMIHKVRTGTAGLPLEARQLSKAWLDKHKARSWDDGDLSKRKKRR